jgi:hypothetical protein
MVPLLPRPAGKQTWHDQHTGFIPIHAMCARHTQAPSGLPRHATMDVKALWPLCCQGLRSYPVCLGHHVAVDICTNLYCQYSALLRTMRPPAPSSSLAWLCTHRIVRGASAQTAAQVCCAVMLAMVEIRSLYFAMQHIRGGSRHRHFLCTSRG